MKVRFTADYDHRWPSRAVTAFKAGYEGTVKREVGERAISKGKATEIDRHATPAPDASGNDGRADSLGRGNNRSPDTGSAGGIRGRSSRDGGDHGRALLGDKLAGDVA